MNWKVGDWCFYEAQLAVIEEMEDERVRSVSTGYINTSGNDLSDCCFPLSKHVVRVSGEVEHAQREIRSESGPVNLNWPDIHRQFVGLWIAACNSPENDKDLYKEINAFTDALRDAIRTAKALKADDIPLFR